MSAPKPRIRLLDTTLRDGGYHIDFQFTAKETAAVARGLDEAGFDYIEVGHGLGLGASGPSHGVAAASDDQYVEAAAGAVKKAKTGAFFIPGIGAKEHLRRARDLGLRLIRIGTNVTQSALARPYIEYAKELGLEVSYNFMKSYAVGARRFAEIASEAASWGADSLVIVDSAGGMLPHEVRDFVKKTRERCSTPVGIHAHNNLQLAVVNTLEAIAAGASIVDVSLRGMGRSAGNAQADILLVLLRKLGYQVGADLFRTMEISEELIVPRLSLRAQGSDPEEVVSGMALFHSAFMPMIEEAGRAHGVDFRDLILRVCAKDIVSPSPKLVHDEAARLAAEGSRPFVPGNAKPHRAVPSVRLRPARHEDAELVRHWRNDAATRTQFFDPKPVEPAAHASWFQAHRKGARCRIYIMLDPRDRPLGQIRLERGASRSAEISVSVDAAERGKGIGAAAILCLDAPARKWGVRTLIAHAKADNVASLLAFVKAGFAFMRRVSVEGRPAYRLEKKL